MNLWLQFSSSELRNTLKYHLERVTNMPSTVAEALVSIESDLHIYRRDDVNPRFCKKDALGLHSEIYRTEIIPSVVKETLFSIENDLYVDRADGNVATCRKTALETFSPFKMLAYYWTSKTVVRRDPATLESAQQNLAWYYFHTQNTISFSEICNLYVTRIDPNEENKKALRNKFDDLTEYYRTALALLESCKAATEYDSLDERIREFIQGGITAFKRRINDVLVQILVLLNNKNSSNMGIGKGVEGYIPFITWARGSLNSQLVNQHSLLTS